MNNPKLVFVFDIDGTLSPPGKGRVSKEVRALLKRALPYPAFVASGMDGAYCEEVVRQIGGAGWFGETGAVYRRGRDAPVVNSNGGVRSLLDAIEFSPWNNRDGLAFARLGECTSILSFDPRARKGSFVIRPDPTGAYPSARLCEFLQEVIRERGLKVSIVGPYPDGNLDLVSYGRDDERISKATVIKLLREWFPEAGIVVFGDGENDVSMAELADLVVTFANGHPELKRIAQERGGIVVPLPGPEGGCAMGIQWALQRFGAKSAVRNS
ncbi:MAG: HAD family phosphatase [Candidatus Wildermuthbacteria bacterium]|nr:HAD family phosphatase [Candidatus Wildermuthbacteria bacterium]